MPIEKKAPKKESAAPVIDLPQARVKVLEAELHPEPYTVTRESDGQEFEIDPNLNCRVEIVDDLADGEYDGVTFYETFKLKQDDEGDWTIRDGTKLAALAKARYGRDFFEDGNSQVFDENDLIDFEFLSKVVPKINFNTGQVVGSMLHFETIMAIPSSTGKKKNKEAAKAESEEKKAQVQAEEDEDFDSIPF